jgi:hypothetical protein
MKDDLIVVSMLEALHGPLNWFFGEHAGEGASWGGTPSSHGKPS